jgi:hypothetical protein
MDPLLARASWLAAAPLAALLPLLRASGILVAVSAAAAAAAAAPAPADADADAPDIDADAPGAAPLADDAGEATLRKAIARARGLLP